MAAGGKNLGFDPSAHDRVVGLIRDRTNAPGGVRDTAGFGDRLCAPLRDAPVQNLALADGVAVGAHGFFEWSISVGPVALVQIDIVRSEAPQRTFWGV